MSSVPFPLFEPTLWQRAGWMNLTYVIPAESPPALGLVFGDADAATAIFTGWHDRLGSIDQHELLRVALIEGPLRDTPAGYTVHVGVDPLAEHPSATAGEGAVVTSCRVATPGCPSLRRFKAAFEKHARYLLVPAFVRQGVEVMPHLAIGKRRLALRSVSDVGLVGDPDARLWGRL